MKSFCTNWFFTSFWASPKSSIYALILASNDWSTDRKARSLDPGFQGDEPSEAPRRPARSTLTDVPVPEPREVPVHEPQDVPPPVPGVVPEPAKPPRTDPKPRRMP